MPLNEVSKDYSFTQLPHGWHFRTWTESVSLAGELVSEGNIKVFGRIAGSQIEIIPRPSLIDEHGWKDVGLLERLICLGWMTSIYMGQVVSCMRSTALGRLLTCSPVQALRSNERYRPLTSSVTHNFKQGKR